MTKLEEKIQRANCELPADVLAALRKAVKNETSARGRQFLKLIEENIAIAKKKSFPLCQDTGIVSFHLPVVKDTARLREAVKKAYGRLRNSQMKKPFEKKVDRRNIPSINLAPDSFAPSFLIRGGGAMNCSGLIMANPSSAWTVLAQEIADFIISKAPFCCPPLFVGLGIGGSPQEALISAERMLLKDQSSAMSAMEKKIYGLVNKSGIGPGGWGGKNTVLCVRIEELPRHIATMSVGIAMSCWCLRKGRL